MSNVANTSLSWGSLHGTAVIDSTSCWAGMSFQQSPTETSKADTSPSSTISPESSRAASSSAAAAMSTTRPTTHSADSTRAAMARPLPLRPLLPMRTRATMAKMTASRTPPMMPNTSAAMAKPSVPCAAGGGPP
jgi:hypothetical protein